MLKEAKDFLHELIKYNKEVKANTVETHITSQCQMHAVFRQEKKKDKCTKITLIDLNQNSIFKIETAWQMEMVTGQ